jgi:hypothetical protein
VPAGVWRSTTRLIAGNWLFAAAFLPALLLRVDAELGYRWQSWFNDSFSYISAAVTLTPGTVRPSGYPLYLWLLSPAHSFLLVTASQQLMGLLVGVLIYALARHRFHVPAWLAVLFALPVLYDGFEIQLEHLIMADTLFLFLCMAAITVMLWSPGGTTPRTPRGGSPRPSWWACLAAGLLLGLSSLVRSTGLPLLAVFAVYVLIRLVPGRGEGWRRAWRRLVVGLVVGGIAFAAPVAGYEAWYKSAHGEFALTDSTGIFLYSRVMTFADCSRMSLPADLLPLCTAVPPAQRPIAQAYIWTPPTPLNRYPGQIFSPTVNKLAERFAITAIEAQPLDYARVVWDDTVKSFGWARTAFPNGQTYDAYLFGTSPLPVPHSPYHGYSSAAAYYARGTAGPVDTVVSGRYATIIRAYQRYVWLPGTLYGLILLIGLAGILIGPAGILIGPAGIVGRRRRHRGVRGGVPPGDKAGDGVRYDGALCHRMPSPALLPWLCSLALIVAPAATAEFDYRYVTTAVPFACLAAALAFARRPDEPGRADQPASSPADRGADEEEEEEESGLPDVGIDVSGAGIDVIDTGGTDGTRGTGAGGTGAGRETGGAPLLPRRIPGSSPLGRLPDARHDQGDLPSDAD